MTHTDAFVRKTLPTRESHACPMPRISVQMLFVHPRDDGCCCRRTPLHQVVVQVRTVLLRVVDALPTNNYWQPQGLCDECLDVTFW
jgi:hypothetical protein